MVESEALTEINGYYVVSDQVFEQLGLPESVDASNVWEAEGGQYEQVLEAAKN